MRRLLTTRLVIVARRGIAGRAGGTAEASGLGALEALARLSVGGSERCHDCDSEDLELLLGFWNEMQRRRQLQSCEESAVERKRSEGFKGECGGG